MLIQRNKACAFLATVPALAGVASASITGKVLVNGSQVSDAQPATVDDSVGTYSFPLVQVSTNYDFFTLVASYGGNTYAVENFQTVNADLTGSDGLSYSSAVAALLATVLGKTAVTEGQVDFKGRDGSTTKVSVTYGPTPGQRTGSTVS